MARQHLALYPPLSFSFLRGALISADLSAAESGQGGAASRRRGRKDLKRRHSLGSFGEKKKGLHLL